MGLSMPRTPLLFRAKREISRLVLIRLRGKERSRTTTSPSGLSAPGRLSDKLGMTGWVARDETRLCHSERSGAKDLLLLNGRQFLGGRKEKCFAKFTLSAVERLRMTLLHPYHSDCSEEPMMSFRTKRGIFLFGLNKG